MGLVDPRGGADAWLRALRGAGGRGPVRAAPSSEAAADAVPPSAAGAVPCPNCGTGLRLVDRAPADARTVILVCPRCGRLVLGRGAGEIPPP